MEDRSFCLSAVGKRKTEGGEGLAGVSEDRREGDLLHKRRRGQQSGWVKAAVGL